MDFGAPNAIKISDFDVCKTVFCMQQKTLGFLPASRLKTIENQSYRKQKVFDASKIYDF